MRAAPETLSRRQWLISSGAALAGLALSSRFLNEELRAQLTPERLAAVAPVKARLSLNENPFGPSPAAVAAMQEAVTGHQPSRYPYARLPELLSLISAKEDAPAEQIVLSVGSGEILESVGVMFGAQGADVIYATPGYVQLPRAAEAMGGRLVGVPLNVRLEHDLGAMAQAVANAPGKAVVYLANPHNPTGTVVESAALRAFIKEVTPRAFVFVDEAYLDIAEDYAGWTVVDLVKSTPNLLVARTFSKIYGLAGMRIGYGVTSAGFAGELRKYAIGTLTGPSIEAAIASLRDERYVAATRAKIVAERAKLEALLRELGRECATSQTNFVFFRTGRPHVDVQAAMREEGVGIARAFPPLLDWARISIGLPEENALARAALRKVLAG